MYVKREALRAGATAAQRKRADRLRAKGAPQENLSDDAIRFSAAGPADSAAFKQGRIRRTVDELVHMADENKTWRDWYDRHKETVERMFGADAELFQRILSATSQLQTVKGNVTMALRAYEMMVSGQPFVGFLPAAAKNLDRIRAGLATSGPKISEFERGNLGHDDAMAVDRHIAQLLFNTSSPSRAQIESAKRRIRKVADQLGWTYREAQAALWAANQVRLGVDPEKVVSYDRVLEARTDLIEAIHARNLARGGAGVSAGRATAARVGQAGTGKAGEAGYVLNFRDADALRSAAATAERKRGDRLRAKGVPEEGLTGGLPLFAVDGTSSPAQTATYGKATPAHQAAAAKLAAKLQANYRRPFVFDAVDARSGTDAARQKELATVSEALAAYFKHEVVWVRFPGAPAFSGVVSNMPGAVFLNFDGRDALCRRHPHLPGRRHRRR